MLATMPKQIVRPQGLPDPGPTRSYSHAVRSGNLLFLAGQTGIDAHPRDGIGRFEAQTRRAFERMEAILKAAGGSLENLVTMTVFITDIRFGDEFVRLRGEISGYRGQHGSGHAYFSLKDGQARIDAVVWKGVFGRLRQRPQEGLEVIATGRITTFAGKSS